jgi:hypothetical protein
VEYVRKQVVAYCPSVWLFSALEVNSSCRDASCRACLSRRDFLYLTSSATTRFLFSSTSLLLPTSRAVPPRLDIPRPCHLDARVSELLIYLPFQLLLLTYCIYFGHLRRQTQYQAAVSCILSTHLPCHVRLTARISRISSIYHHVQGHHSSSYELQYHIRRFAYAPQGPLEVLLGCRRPQDRYFSRGTGPGGTRLRPEPPSLCPIPRVWLTIDREHAGYEAAHRYFYFGHAADRVLAAECLRRL